MQKLEERRHREVKRQGLVSGADRIVRLMLPIVLESRGLTSSADSLRELPALRDVGSVNFALEAVGRAARGAGPARRAVLLCGEAALAAIRGDAGRFASLVRDAAESLREATPGLGLHN